MIALLGPVVGLIKLALKLLWWCGVYWLFICMAPVWIFEVYANEIYKEDVLFGIHRNQLGNILAPEWLYTVTWYLTLVMMALTILQNLIRIFKQDPKFSIFKAIFGVVTGHKKKAGFVAKLNRDDLKGVKDISGFVFGKLKGKYVTKREDTDGHILVIGGAGSGKSSCIAIPTLMSWKERVFAIDIKKELYNKTSRARGQDFIKIFDPTDPAANGYDPFYLLKNTDDPSGEAKSLAMSICPLPPDVKDPYWIKNAQSMLTGFLLYELENGLNFSEAMLDIKSQPVKTLVDEIMNGNNTRAKLEISQFSGMDDKTISGIFSELSSHITTFATSDDLQRALSGRGECITPEDLENGYDIFCCIPEHKLEQWKELLGMMCNQFLKAFERREDGNNKPILFLIDEFGRLGKIETITNGLATLRSKKIEIALFVQSKSQLNAIYGKDVSEIIADNCAYKAILKASEPNTQEWCSKLVGTYDKQKLSSNLNADMIGIGKGTGTGRTTEERRIIKPEEFAYLQDIVCLFPTGYQRIEKTPYYQDKTFKNK